MAPDASGPKGIFDIGRPSREAPGPEFAREPVAPAPDPSIRGVGFDAPRPTGGTPIPVNRPAGVQPAGAAVPPAPGRPSMPVEPPRPPRRPGFGAGLFGRSAKPAASMPLPSQPPAPPKPHRSFGSGKLLVYLLIFLAVVAGLYLAADSGVIRGGSHLPLHIFSKYKSPAASSSSTASTAPAGFQLYKLTDAGIQFDAPTTWGTPTSGTDPGYSKRGGGNKSDGVHAYVVNFANNKNVQLAFTSGSLLSASKNDNRYFDDLQWCVGSFDKRIYLQRMAFTTTKGIDTPATVVCAQGPLSNATQLNSTTVEITKVKALDGSNLGNVYVMDLSGNPNVVVMRVLDTSGSNDANIKTLLDTAKNL